MPSPPAVLKAGRPGSVGLGQEAREVSLATRPAFPLLPLAWKEAFPSSGGLAFSTIVIVSPSFNPPGQPDHHPRPRPDRLVGRAIVFSQSLRSSLARRERVQESGPSYTTTSPEAIAITTLPSATTGSEATRPVSMVLNNTSPDVASSANR